MIGTKGDVTGTKGDVTGTKGDVTGTKSTRRTIGLGAGLGRGQLDCDVGLRTSETAARNTSGFRCLSSTNEASELALQVAAPQSLRGGDRRPRCLRVPLAASARAAPTAAGRLGALGARSGRTLRRAAAKGRRWGGTWLAAAAGLRRVKYVAAQRDGPGPADSRMGPALTAGGGGPATGPGRAR